MRPSQIVTALNLCLDVQQPVMIWGSPGVGKSDTVAQTAKERNVDLIDLRLSQLDSVDLRGVPSVDRERRRTDWNSPSILPYEGKGILFLDEINSAPQGVTAAAYQLILDRRLGDYVLPDGWNIVAAGNRVSDRAIVNQMPTPLKNRFAHLYFEVNNDDWLMWALKNNVASEVISFIRFRPTMLNEFEPRNSTAEERDRVKQLKDSNSFATPRSWWFASRQISKGIPKDIEYDMLQGTIGEQATAEFLGYMKYHRDMPSIDSILMNPGTAKVPEQPATLYAVATTLASKATLDNMERVVKYALRLPAEYQILLMKDAIIRDESLSDSKSFVEWSLENSDVLF